MDDTTEKQCNSGRFVCDEDMIDELTIFYGGQRSDVVSRYHVEPLKECEQRWLDDWCEQHGKDMEFMIEALNRENDGLQGELDAMEMYTKMLTNLIKEKTEKISKLRRLIESMYSLFVYNDGIDSYSNTVSYAREKMRELGIDVKEA